jgi:endo-1,4-beta-xylanase
MKNINILIVLACFFVTTYTYGQLAKGSPKFLGNISAYSIRSDFDTYWNQITPENGSKWGTVENTRNVMNWTQLDLGYQKAKEKGYAFKLHTLVWGSQYPTWITSLSSEEQKKEIIEWYQALATRYPDVDQIDVVNEPIKTAMPFKAALGGDGATGWDWVIESFKLARQYFPKAKLLINEYGTENDGSARNRYITIINLLKDRNLIDAVGIQAHHFNVDNMTAAQMKSTLDIYAGLNLPTYITELDIIATNETTQRDKYAQLIPVMWNHPNVHGITLWGYVEGSTWKAGTGILNRDGTERLAMKWLKDYFKSVPTREILRATSHKVYPTLSLDGQITVSTPSDKATVEVINTIGQKMIQTTINGANGQISLPNIKGSYYLVVKSDEGTSTHAVCIP